MEGLSSLCYAVLLYYHTLQICAHSGKQRVCVHEVKFVFLSRRSSVDSSWLLLGHIAVLRTYMRPILTDRVASFIGLSVTLVSPAKTAAPIELPFGLRTWVSPGNHVLDEGPDPPWKGANFGGKWASHCKV